MKICYLVYREDNVMVFNSQILEYLYMLKNNPVIDQTELVVFRQTDKQELENKIKRFVDIYKTFSSQRTFTVTQLNANARRLKSYVLQRYEKHDEIAVICRGDSSAFIAAKAFKDFPNSRILYDNRGLPIEESKMRGDTFLHKIKRGIQKRVKRYAKSHCDMYNFVTTAMKDFYIEKYGYNADLPCTVIPTLYSAQPADTKSVQDIRRKENISDNDIVISYIGSTAVWQSTDRLIEIIKDIGKQYHNARFLILTNGSLNCNGLPDNIRTRITVKSVPHNQIVDYLAVTDIGIVIRDNNIVNKVAAPTKIAEYLTNGIPLLYSGDIGILTDLKNNGISIPMINIDTDTDWLSHISKFTQKQKRDISNTVAGYFDMKTRQNQTVNMITKSFKAKKVR